MDRGRTCRRHVAGETEVVRVCMCAQSAEKKTGLSQSKFSAKFGIPVRILQQWEQGISSPPEYLVRMMAYIMVLEGGREDNGQGKLNSDRVELSF